MKKIFLITCNLLIGVMSFALPVITTFSPSSGPIGSSVTITGTGFNTTANQNVVFFGATQAVVTAASSTSLTVTVPLGANYQHISVTNLADNLTAYSLQPFNVTFSGNILFANSTSFPSGGNLNSVKIGDIDGDGKADLVATDGAVRVFRNLSTPGAINFAVNVGLGVSGTAVWASIGDIDGDGKPDLAVADQSNSSIAVFLNTSTSGTISFATALNFSTGAFCNLVVIGDIDGDGKPDLATANFNSGNVSVLRNTSTLGTISFATKIDYATGSGCSSVAIGDIDGDGKTDLVSANNYSKNISVLRNTSTSGSISFATKVDFTVASSSQTLGIQIGNIDGDGKLDVVVTGSLNGVASVFLNTSTVGVVNFATKVDFSLSNPSSVSLGDIDGDGRLDIATSDLGLVSVLRNTSTIGTASFATKVDFTIGGNYSLSLDLGDIDNDGRTDLVATNGTNASVLRQIVPLPSISSFTPSSGCANTSSVVITGTNFTDATSVTIGGTNVLSFVVNSATQITAVVGNNNTGTIVVTTANGSATSAGTFTVNPLPSVTITQNGITLTANQSSATYQWLDCNNSNQPILGETNQSFTAIGNGDYAVVVTMGGCIDTSACVNITGVGFTEIEMPTFALFPNPTTDFVTLQIDQNFTLANIEIINTLGQVIFANQTNDRLTKISMPSESGIYFVRVEIDGVTSIHKIIKE